ncbi:hypothetical protein [Wolbachia endosymbiont of Tettigetta isshikii]|uniref:hypothetical protein n=1 Tax=Wolbachia endosymbiont of Tettigetta isshikii TaxID=3239093 RepID=UPI003980FAEA
MQKYTFNMVCTDDTVGGESRYKMIKLIWKVNGKEKTIKLCGPCIDHMALLNEVGKNFLNYGLGVQNIISVKVTSVTAGQMKSSTKRKIFPYRMLN